MDAFGAGFKNDLDDGGSKSRGAFGHTAHLSGGLLLPAFERCMCTLHAAYVKGIFSMWLFPVRSFGDSTPGPTRVQTFECAGMFVRLAACAWACCGASSRLLGRLRGCRGGGVNCGSSIGARRGTKEGLNAKTACTQCAALKCGAGECFNATDKTQDNACFECGDNTHKEGLNDETSCTPKTLECACVCVGPQ